MKQSASVRMAYIAILLVSVLALLRCATIIESSCDLQSFEGTYAGKYNVGGIIPIPIEDTITITVDLDNNEATMFSVLLDTSFVVKYQEVKSRLYLGALVFDTFVLGEDSLFNISIRDGFATLDGECDKLYLQMNKVSVADHTFEGFPKPINNLDLTTPNFMRRL